jgi:hypothetical protein
MRTSSPHQDFRRDMKGGAVTDPTCRIATDCGTIRLFHATLIDECFDRSEFRPSTSAFRIAESLATL